MHIYSSTIISPPLHSFYINQTMDAPSDPGEQPQWMANRYAFFWYVVAFYLTDLNFDIATALD